ncbi:hypothetical protein ACFQQB_36530 [Nonomuraea rubra]|uniref:hypothetical protein n=1 Tax=Nonomuraea rubra TaxID=46180 RepID=UPI00362287A4
MIHQQPHPPGRGRAAGLGRGVPPAILASAAATSSGSGGDRSQCSSGPISRSTPGGSG